MEEAGTQHHSIILFYKYHALSPDFSVTARYRQALERLCQSLHLKGRILVGCSQTEGLNGTLAGRHEDVRAFTLALLHAQQQPADDDNGPAYIQLAKEEFWKESEAFFRLIEEPELRFDSPDEFKWSSCASQIDELFPDLHIKLVSELIGTGGVLSTIPLEETAKGYLTPAEWHDRLSRRPERDDDDDTVLIDCRNTKEYAIGHFVGATDPKTTTFAQFPKWVEDNKVLLEDKTIMMYCTGGIRCEKASAFIRKTIPSVKEVSHLKGGIHKYLEEYGGNDLWRGRNFVFDGRGAASADETKPGVAGPCHVDANLKTTNDVVGRCVDCDAPFDSFDPHCVCTVCREPTLVCRNCQNRLAEYHCRNHSHLRLCYFSDLKRYTADEIANQLFDLRKQFDEIAVGRRFRQKRQTLLKQIDRVGARMSELQSALLKQFVNDGSENLICRNCGGNNECTGRCWGFYGLKRKDMLETQSKGSSDTFNEPRLTESATIVSKPQRFRKGSRREDLIAELVELNASMSPSEFRNQSTGIRVPPCITRYLQCTTKAKWCGQSVLRVVQSEFAELGKPEVMKAVLANGLLRLNGIPVAASEVSELKLKSSDSLGRILHWHEAPVIVPTLIPVEKIKVSSTFLEEYGAFGDEDDGIIYVCNKPASVPVHPAGPYLSNSLTMMVEAQVGLLPQSLNPLHRTDRVTSGLTLCGTSTAVSRAFHKSLMEGAVDKLYLAQVCGKFPASSSEADTMLNSVGGIGFWSWSEKGLNITVDAPVHTVDVAAGLRSVDVLGKPSQSIYKLLAYESASDTSLVSCFPVTGRNHQLRVHLQWLGFPIVNDVQYGGRLEIKPTERIEDSAPVRAMVDAMKNSNSERRVGSLSDEDILAAKRACPCCRGDYLEGIVKSFSPAQLLFEGRHAICLHALWYRVRILPKKTKLANGDISIIPPLEELCFSVGPPEWANQTALKQLEWLGS